MKRIISLSLAVVLALSLPVPALAASPYPDVAEGRWSYPSIVRAYNDGVMSTTDGKHFTPTGSLTYAQFYTILTRAYYGGEVAKTPDGAVWYDKYITVADAHGLRNLIKDSDMNAAVNRYEMARIIVNLMTDQGVSATTAQRDGAAAQIKDWDAIPSQYRLAVATVYALGIINGVDSGAFAGERSMTREQCAKVYCSAVDAIAKQPSGYAQPTTPDPKEDPEPVYYGAVGTISEREVTLSYETHAPVVDYWSSQSAEIRGLTNQDMFNAAVQTMKDAELLKTRADKLSRRLDDGIGGVDHNYNYAVFRSSATYDTNKMIWVYPDNEMIIHWALSMLQNHGMGFHAAKMDDGLSFIKVGPNISDAAYANINPILATIPAGASDMQKAEICQKALVNRFDYGSGSFSWTSSAGSTGSCDSYSLTTRTIMSAADIPTLQVSGSKVNHAWNQSFIDGVWYAVDSQVAEGYFGIMTMREYESLGGGVQSDAYHTYNNSSTAKVARALCESAWG